MGKLPLLNPLSKSACGFFFALIDGLKLIWGFVIKCAVWPLGIVEFDVRSDTFHKGTVSLSRDEIKRFEVRKNDIFFTRTSETPEEVGLSAVLLEEIPDCVFSGFVLRGRPKNDILIPEYCKYCFSAKAVREKSSLIAHIRLAH